MLCPSARPDDPEGRAFRSGFVPLRVAAPCQEKRCHHFADENCQLARRVVRHLPARSELPVCPIRSDCRWFAQEGKAACHRCLDIATQMESPTPLQRYVADDPNAEPWYWISLRGVVRALDSLWRRARPARAPGPGQG